MQSKEVRSCRWVVFMYVLGAGLVIPFAVCGFGFVPAMVAAALVPMSMDDCVFQMIGLLYTILGFWGGALVLLSQMQREVSVDRPSRCTLPSIIAFAILSALWVWGWSNEGLLNPSGGAVIYVVIVAVFAFLTNRGFAKMEAQAGEPQR